MAINKVMMAALKALSYADIDVKKNYKADRALNRLAQPLLKGLYRMWDQVISLDGHDIPVRVFEPRELLSSEVLLFFHGGGWVSGDIDSYIRPCAALADHTGRWVASVDYRLAPEFPFPAGLEDCYRAAREITREGWQIALVGDSAGGNLCAAVSLMARDRGEFEIRRQVLIYPAVNDDHTSASPFESIVKNGTDFLLTSRKICDYIDLYIPDPQDRKSPYFAPLLAESLANQPETLVITAEFDPLRDEGEAYALRLQAESGRCVLLRTPDALHGFFSLPTIYPQVPECLARIRQFLNGEEIQ